MKSHTGEHDMILKHTQGEKRFNASYAEWSVTIPVHNSYKNIKMIVYNIPFGHPKGVSLYPIFNCKYLRFL